jgi:trehalose/maltose hydrolase-like predicted phosphorylase
VMVAWLCELANEVLSLLPVSRADALRARLEISEEELRLWQDMGRRMFVPFHGDGLISQFEGYEALEELDWDGYRAKYGNIQRLDRILRAEGDDPNRYKIAKQADTVMLFFLFSPSGLRQLFERLGYEYRADTAARNIAYYDQRTSHGSTLSFITHAGVLAKLDPESSWERFLVALNSDVGDIQGGTTREGIHMGVMAGTLDLMQRAYLGTEIRDNVLYFEPRLPGPIEELSFAIQFRRTPLLVTFNNDWLTLALHPEGASGPISVGVGGEIRELCPGDRCTFRLSPAMPAE